MTFTTFSNMITHRRTRNILFTNTPVFLESNKWLSWSYNKENNKRNYVFHCFPFFSDLDSEISSLKCETTIKNTKDNLANHWWVLRKTRYCLQSLKRFVPPCVIGLWNMARKSRMFSLWSRIRYIPTVILYYSNV